MKRPNEIHIIYSTLKIQYSGHLLEQERLALFIHCIELRIFHEINFEDQITECSLVNIFALVNCNKSINFTSFELDFASFT